nr:MAG: hypothetical protein DIU58_17515 [Sphaerobacter thermophilus]
MLRRRTPLKAKVGLKRKTRLRARVVIHRRARLRAITAPRGFPKRVREAIFERDGYRCQHPGCGATRDLQAHHIKFVSQGGGHFVSNGVTLCPLHHNEFNGPNPHHSIVWRRYWEQWAEERYGPDYWRMECYDHAA